MTDDHVKRPLSGSDLKLLWRLWPMVRPIKNLLFLAVFLIILAAVLSLMLPYVTKIAIDRYIVPTGQLFQPKEGMPPIGQELLASGHFMESGRPGFLYLEPESADFLNKREEEELIEKGFLSRERYYVKVLDSEGRRLAAEFPALAKNDGRLLIIEEKNLNSFPEGQLVALRQSDVDGLLRLAVIFAVLMVAAYGLEFAQRVMVEIGAQKMGHTLRQKLMEHLFTLSQSFFDRQLAGRLTSRVTNDVNNLNQLIKSTVSTVFSDIISMIGVSVIMLILSPKLALITFIFTPVTFILSSYFGNLSRKLQRSLRSQLAVINQNFSESIAGISVIQAFRREKKNTEIFQSLNHENYKMGVGQLKIHAVFMPLIDLFASVVLALIIWYGGGEVLDDNLSLGVLAAFIGYARRFFMPIQDVAEKINIFQSAFASLERIWDIFDEDDKIKLADQSLAPVRPGGKVEFRNVNFRYDQDGPQVLKNISFTIKPGESVALVGSTGSGKSTIISLMLRFYDPESGGIYFDDLPLKQLNLKAHSERLGLVTQDIYLYSATVMENLRLGRTNVSDEKVKAAAKAVGADRFIEMLPHGYDEPLGPGGRHLSTGERQLLACARALIDTPEIVILDEATASVDSENELLIENALSSLLKGRTSIVIAHRLSTIKRVDRILVLSDGQIVESGSHEELLAERGLYFRLAALLGAPRIN